MVAFPPRKDESGHGYWSEVVTLNTATFPERPGIHLIARNSLRNWGPVKRATKRTEGKRSLDVFMRADGGDAMSHVSFDFRARRIDPGMLEAQWVHDEHRDVYALLRRVTGEPRLKDIDLSTAFSAGDLYVLPRLAPGHRDHDLPGATGVGWPDRAFIADALHERLSRAGYIRATDMTRAVHRSRNWTNPFARSKARSASIRGEARDAVLRTVTSLGNSDDTLEVVVLHVGDATPGTIRAEIVKYLGEPSQVHGDLLQWSNGLKIQMTCAAADVFAEALPRATLRADEAARLTPAQRKTVLKDREETERALVEQRMRDYVRTLRRRPEDVGCAIVEMNAALRQDPWTDPYALGRHCLAKSELLPQVVLSDGQNVAHKADSAFRDSLRMLGVVSVPKQTATLAALSILQVNARYLGGKRRDAMSLPVAARLKGSVLECALPKSGSPSWGPYARALLRILRGQFEEFPRTRGAASYQRYEDFFAGALEAIAAEGEAVVMLEGSKMRHKVAAVQNGRLAFDRLQLALRSYSPADLPGLVLVRWGSERDKQPFYYHRESTKWPSGIFRWGGQKRTGYAIKTKPHTVRMASMFATKSRHGQDATWQDRSATRAQGQLDEFCVMFMSPGTDPVGVMSYLQKLREGHTQYDSATSAPFPLHELQLLSRAFTADHVAEEEDDDEVP